MSYRIIPTFEQISEQITNQLCSLITNSKPKLVKMIKIVAIPPTLFLVTQLLRKIWYTSYHRYKKYPPGMISLHYKYLLILYTHNYNKVQLVYHSLVSSSNYLILSHFICISAKIIQKYQCIKWDQIDGKLLYLTLIWC